MIFSCDFPVFYQMHSTATQKCISETYSSFSERKRRIVPAVDAISRTVPDDCDANDVTNATHALRRILHFLKDWHHTQYLQVIVIYIYLLYVTAIF